VSGTIPVAGAVGPTADFVSVLFLAPEGELLNFDGKFQLISPNLGSSSVLAGKTSMSQEDGKLVNPQGLSGARFFSQNETRPPLDYNLQ
jgi:hypothetical protein